MHKNYNNWLLYCLSLINLEKKSLVMDLACGKGESSMILAEQGFSVVSVDISSSSLNTFNSTNIKKICKDVEDLDNWPLCEQAFKLIFVRNFLNRSIFPKILKSVDTGGYLVYETFSEGNEKYGSPKNKNFILKSRELLEITKKFSPICYESIEVDTNLTGFVKQRLLARNV